MLLLDTTGTFPTSDLLVYVPSLFVLVGATDDRARTERHNEGGDLVVEGFATFGGVTITD